MLFLAGKAQTSRVSIWRSAFNTARTVRDLIRAGAAGLPLEDHEQELMIPRN